MISFSTAKTKKMSGMTLLEILLYISISGIVIFAASSLISIIYEVKQKGRVITAVEQEGTLASYTIEKFIQNARTVFHPDLYRDSDRLGVGVIINNRESNVFLSLVDGVIYSETNNKEKIALTSNDIIISDLNFKYYGSSENGFVSYYFVVSGGDPESRINYQRSFSGGASIR